MNRFVTLFGLALAVAAGAACDQAPTAPSVVPSSNEASLHAKPGSSTLPATAIFRCPGDCSLDDKIRGDGAGSYSAVLNVLKPLSALKAE